MPVNTVLLADEDSVYDGNDLGLGYVVDGEVMPDFVDFDAEFAKLQEDLTVIYNK